MMYTRTKRNKVGYARKSTSVKPSANLASQEQLSKGILQILSSPFSNARDIKNIIENDPTMTANVLRHANSAAVGSRQEITDLNQAVIWIGFETLKQMVITRYSSRSA